MDNRILAHRGWRVTDGLVGSFEMLRAEQGLRDACSSGNRAGLREITEQLSVEKLDQLLSNGRDYPTGTPVFEAILCEQAGILEDLIGLGCDLEQECSLDIFFPVHFVDTGPALSVACAMGNTRCVSVLLKAGASVNHAGQNTTPLLSACQDGNTDLINLLLEAGADPNLSPRALPGHTALHVSCLAHDDIDNVRLLIAYGADVNKSDKDGEISAFKACTAANWNVAELLLQNEDLLSSSEDIVKMFWVLGAECLARLENHDLTDKYWTWAATLDPDFSIYNNMVEKLLSPEQVNAGIHQALHSSADLTALLRNRQQVELQALVFLYLVFRWGKETISCRTGLISSALRKQQPWLTCKLLMFSENMTDSVSCYDVSSLCENISQTVEDLLELYFVDKRQSKEHLNVIITGIISQILRLFEKVVKSSDLGVKKALKLSHLQCTQMKPKQERAQQLIEAFLGLVKFGHSLTQDLDVVKQYNDKLRKFCQLCELPSAKQAKLNCTTWQVVVSGGPCCKHSLTWQHHNLFPCPSITQLLSDFGLDINCRDLNRNTPLHDALLCLEPSREVVQTLVKNGAEIDLPNKDGIRPYSILSKNLCYSVNVVEFTSLKSLASQVVIKHKVPYLEILPKTLAEFVQARDVNQANNGFWKT